MTPREGNTSLKPGWLKRQADKARKDIKKWPKWMKEALKRGHI